MPDNNLEKMFQSLQGTLKDFIDVKQYLQDALNDLKEMDTLLTDLKKTNTSLSASALEALKDNSFRIADAYGRKATDYLSAVQSASDAGFRDAEGIARLSLAVQTAGNLTANLADSYIRAADSAYSLGGSVEQLTKILDGSNLLADRNHIQLADLADGMTLLCSRAEEFGISADETAAALGTLLASTGQDSADLAGSLETLLLYLCQITDEAKGIDTAGLSRCKQACEELGVSLTETVNGFSSIRSPMEILKELSAALSSLSATDSRRAGLLNAVGGDTNGEALSALLTNYSLYEKMLQDYADGTGSLAADAEKAASSWEGSLNRLSNTWTQTIGSLADSDAVTAAIDSLNGLLNVLNKVTDFLGSSGSIGAGLGALLSAKNVGNPKKFGFLLF